MADSADEELRSIHVSTRGEVVTHANRSVVVEIMDRGPTKRLVNEGRKIDLNRAAFAKPATQRRIS